MRKNIIILALGLFLLQLFLKVELIYGQRKQYIYSQEGCIHSFLSPPLMLNRLKLKNIKDLTTLFDTIHGLLKQNVPIDYNRLDLETKQANFPETPFPIDHSWLFNKKEEIAQQHTKNMELLNKLKDKFSIHYMGNSWGVRLCSIRQQAGRYVDAASTEKQHTSWYISEINRIIKIETEEIVEVDDPLRDAPVFAYTAAQEITERGIKFSESSKNNPTELKLLQAEVKKAIDRLIRLEELRYSFQRLMYSSKIKESHELFLLINGTINLLDTAEFAEEHFGVTIDSIESIIAFLTNFEFDRISYIEPSYQFVESSL